MSPDRISEVQRNWTARSSIPERPSGQPGQFLQNRDRTRPFETAQDLSMTNPIMDNSTPSYRRVCPIITNWISCLEFKFTTQFCYGFHDCELWQKFRRAVKSAALKGKKTAAKLPRLLCRLLSQRVRQQNRPPSRSLWAAAQTR